MSAIADPAPQPVSYGRRLTQLAAERPDGVALIFAPLGGEERRVTWAELERQANQVARLLADRGIGERDTVVIGFPNSPEHVAISFALWKLGGMVLTLRAALPPYERDAILDLARPALVISDWEGLAYPNLPLADLVRAADYEDSPLPDKVSDPGRALASGGSTGRPKIIVSPGRWSASRPMWRSSSRRSAGGPIRFSLLSGRSTTAPPGLAGTAASSTATPW